MLATQSRDGDWGHDLATALAVNALINFGYNGPAAEHAIAVLLNNQNDHGYWPNNMFFRYDDSYYGSPDLTTAVAVEALNSYRQLLAQNQDLTPKN